MDNTTAVVFVKDLDLRYVLINREYERRFQVQRDQICGKTDFDILPQEVAEAVRASDRRVIETGAPLQFEESVPTAEGERNYIVVKFLLRDGSGKPYAICGRTRVRFPSPASDRHKQRTGWILRLWKLPKSHM
jgi:PAS domain-containing protein